MRFAMKGIALTTLLGLAAAAEAGAAVKVQPGPLVAAPEGGVFVDAVFRADGSVLAATGDAVFLIDAAGQARLLGRGERSILDPAGEGYGLWVKDRFELFDLSGQRRGSLPAPPLATFKLVPGSKLVYAPRTRVREEAAWVESARLVRPDGTVESESPAPGLQISRLLPDRIVYTLPGSLVARRLDGQELWRAPLRVHKLETAADRVILVPLYVPGRVVHLDKGSRLSEEPVDGVVWNLAIAPGGSASAATTQTALYLFRDGKRAGQLRLPVAFANSLDVSDRGEALVGGQDREGTALLFLAGPDGTLLWSGRGGSDRGAYRPAVRFAPNGDRFLVLERRGLTIYDILRSQP